MLVLASNSPRRKQLLALGGWDFVVVSAQVDEGIQPGELPEAYVRRLSANKAQAALLHIGSLSPGEDILVIAADTTVAYQSSVSYEILGKPVDARDAERMLRLLRGQIHQVYTSLSVLRVSDQRMLSQVCVTDVPMRNYTDEEMLVYISTGDPMDKAGAYAIQHAGFRPVESLHGCYANVMGLPLCHLTRMLAIFGVAPQANVFQGCQSTLDYACPVFQQVINGLF